MDLKKAFAGLAVGLLLLAFSGAPVYSQGDASKQNGELVSTPISPISPPSET
jgi:hypothetical protein